MKLICMQISFKKTRLVSLSDTTKKKREDNESRTTHYL